MAQWCESCGHALPNGDSSADATWLGEPQVHEHSFARPGGAKTSGRDKKLLLAVVGAFTVWGLFVGLGRIVTPDDAIDQQAATEIEDARLEREERAAAAEAAAKATPVPDGPEVAEADGDYGAADAAPGFRVGGVNVDERVAVTVQVERLQRQLIRRDSAAFVAYRSDQGIVVVDLVGGQSAITDLAPGLSAVFADAHLLRSGASTYAVDPETLRVSRVAQDSSVVVNATLDGNVYLIDSAALSSQGTIVEVVADGVYSFHRLPTGGLQIQLVDGLGVLAVPKSPTGETLIAGVDSFTTLSQNRVLTGSSNAVLEQICPIEDQCELWITSLEGGEQHQVPASFVRFGDQYSLAPDGKALLRYSPEGFAEVHFAGTQSITWVVGVGMHSPAWGPNSDFITWIDRIGDPALRVMFLDERDWLTIDLRDLGAPPPSSAELIVFTADAVPALAADN
jgi:hypothetical protein